MFTPDLEILLLLVTTGKIITKCYTWSDFNHHNTVDFFVCVFRNTTITISKADTKKTSDKAIFLQSYILNVLSRHRNIMADKGLNIFDQCATRCLSVPSGKTVHLFFLMGQ